ncbi:MAG: DinB family protein [Bacteroidetes bacterium]|nr:DinB family protein [Bacteroidota bacterium]MBP7399041.1 DinB family protein [Chitinophagales bacterium]MBP8754339.1 DinB family protein [Chitinophagales bacterium]MBP9190351.1 DinB family protein [Chitinophagales bacterium]MBP9549615.1 DinB family protein [Chitinophagales bacterium]
MNWPEVKAGDYIPYHKAYLDRLPSQCDVPLEFENNTTHIIEFLKSIPKEKLDYRYAVGKWTIKEILGHIIDTERIMSYRALCIARGETQQLPGFEEDEYAAASNANERSIDNLINEMDLLRKSTIAMMRSFTHEMIDSRGNANKHPVTVNAVCRVMAGHELHHLAIIKERYL